MAVEMNRLFGGMCEGMCEAARERCFVGAVLCRWEVWMWLCEWQLFVGGLSFNHPRSRMFMQRNGLFSLKLHSHVLRNR